MAAFFVIQGNDQGRRFDLQEPFSTIGRDPNNHIQLRDPEVSRKHARIELEGGAYHLVDNDSANGVQVNGIPVTRCRLANGDQIQLGRTRLLFALHPTSDSHRGDFVDTAAPEENQANRSGGDATSGGDDYLHHFPLFSHTEAWSPEAVGHLKMMYHTTLVTSQTLEIGVLLQRILDLIGQWVHIDRACVMIYDHESTRLVPKAVWHAEGGHPKRGMPSEASPRFIINRSIVHYVVRRREGILTSDPKSLEPKEDGRWSIRDIICVPMLGRYGLVGVIYLDNLELLEPVPGLGPISAMSNFSLNLDHLRLMIAIAHQAALAVEDTRYYKGMIQAERLVAVGQTVSTLSHHIKNILQGISGGSHLIQTGLDKHNEEMIGRGWAIVEKNQNRISRLILDMLTFSKEREPTYELADIAATVWDIVELLHHQAKEAGVELTFKADRSIPQFFFDVEQIHRALTNIVINGIDAAGPRNETAKEDPDIDSGTETLVSIPVLSGTKQLKGELHVEIVYNRERSKVLVLIDDNGPGISPEQRRYLFRPFYSSKKGRGTGLGLSVAHKVVREHGGVIRIADSPLGGARFEVELPLRLEPPESGESGALRG